LEEIYISGQTISSTPYSFTAGGIQGVSITYPSGSGDICPGDNVRKSVLNIKCDNTPGDGEIDYIVESGYDSLPCIYTILYVYIRERVVSLPLVHNAYREPWSF